MNAELNSENGLLSERLPMVFKYHCLKLQKIAADENTSVDSLRDDAIRSGNVTGGGFTFLNLLM
jgi:hypothetical protein